MVIATAAAETSTTTDIGQFGRFTGAGPAPRTTSPPTKSIGRIKATSSSAAVVALENATGQ
jgi:hypothetical protein